MVTLSNLYNVNVGTLDIVSEVLYYVLIKKFFLLFLLFLFLLFYFPDHLGILLYYLVCY